MNASVLLGTIFIIATANAADELKIAFEGDSVSFRVVGNTFYRNSVMGNQTITKCNETEEVPKCAQWVDDETKEVVDNGSVTSWKEDVVTIENLQPADAGKYYAPEDPKDVNEGEEEPEVDPLTGVETEKKADNTPTVITLVVNGNE